MKVEMCLTWLTVHKKGKNVQVLEASSRFQEMP